MQSLPPKIKAGLPQRRGMSCPVLPTLTELTQPPLDL